MRAGVLRRTAVCVFVCAISSSTLLAEMRTWVDSTGQHKVEAEIVAFKNGKVTLKRPNGKSADFPLTKFSKQDQAYARRWLAENAPQPIGKTKLLAKRFFTLLVDEKFDELKPMMCSAAQANWDSVQEQLKDIELPETARGIYVRNLAAKDDLAEVNVNFKIDGNFKRTKLQFKQESGPWRVVGFIPNSEDETVTSFESSGDEETRIASRNRDEDDDEDDLDDEDLDDDELDDDEEDEDDQAVQIPDGTPEELLAFINKTRRTPRPNIRTRDELIAYQVKLLGTMLAAAEKALEQEPDDQSTLEKLAFAKLEALSTLAVSAPSAEYSTALNRLPNELKGLKLDQLARTAFGVKLRVQLGQARSRSDMQKTINAIQKHYQRSSADDLSPLDIQTLQTTASSSRRLGNEMCAIVNKTFGNLLASSPRTKPLAEQMLGTARRLELIGKPIEVTGITSDSEQFDIKQYEGKVVLVDFWATWCGPCMAEMPNIRKNYEQYRDQGFEVVAISVDRNLESLKNYLDKENPPWTVLVDEHPRNSKKIGDYYGVSAIPTTILVGADGKVITFNCRGASLGKELKKAFSEST